MEQAAIKQKQEIENNFDPLISIVIPVYNVKPYLGRCLESVCTQTYRNIEVIIIDDGSTDGSDVVCHIFERKDSRVHYYFQKNAGLGPARNLGIKVAKGEFIAFIDSDDWVSEDHIELLYRIANKEQADIVRGTLWKYDHQSKQLKGYVLAEYNDKSSVLHYITPHIAGNLYKKILFSFYDIYMPSCYYEDLATYPVLALLSSGVSFCQKPTYFYRVNTGKSIMNSYDNMFDYSIAFDELVALAKKQNLFEGNKELFLKIIIYHMQIALKKFGRYKEASYEQFLKECYSILNKYFEGWEVFYKRRGICFGSYNLSQIVSWRTLEYDLQKKEQRFFFGFSSIISLMSERTEGLNVTHKNIFRKKMIEYEINKSFLSRIKETRDFLVIDFLEERHDILKLNENSYLTLSDALKESNFPFQRYTRIPTDSVEYKILFKHYCLEFIAFLRQNCNCKTIYLLKIYLTSSIQKKRYIEVVNEKLYEYYKFFEDNYPEIIALDIPLELEYTDYNDTFAEGEWYLNKNAFCAMANKLIEIERDELAE